MPDPAASPEMPAGSLPPRLADPLLIARYFYIAIIVVTLLQVVSGLLRAIFRDLNTGGIAYADLISTAFSALAMLFLYYLFFGFVLLVLPRRRAEAIYLRPFRNDDRTAHWRVAINRALDPEVRLSGIRPPRRRTPILFRYANSFIFVLRYATPRYMNLEAGNDWLARLWRSLGEARCAFVDLTGLTPYVAQEIRLVLASLGPRRVLFLGDRSRPEPYWRELVAGQLGVGEGELPAVRIATWDADEARNDASLSEADVRAFMADLPPGLPGPSPATFPMVAESAASVRNRLPGRAWYLLQAALGFFAMPILGAVLGVFSASLLPSGWFLPSLGVMIFLALPLYAAINLYQYIKYCGSDLRRRAAIRFAKVFGGLSVGTPLLILALLMAVQAAREAARSAQCINNLKQIALAMHNYHDTHGAFPPAVTLDSRGRPMHSWRVLLLPYLEQGGESLYSAYHFDQPWDGPDNSRLLARRPQVYDCPSAKAQAPDAASYLVLTGPGGAFRGTREVGLREVTDGTSNTIMMVEAPGRSVPWLEPRDLPVDDFVALMGRIQAEPGVAHHSGGVNSAFLDGAARFLRGAIRPDVLRALASPAGGEVISADSY